MKILALLIAFTLFYESESIYKEGSIVLDGGKLKYIDGIIGGALAYGTYNDSMATTGWGVLDITAKRYNKYSGDQIMYAAGMLEGVFTSERMFQHYDNLKGFLFEGKPSDLKQKLCGFFAKQEKWMKSRILEHKSDPFWISLSQVQNQIEGLYAGYKLSNTKNMTWCAIQTLSGMGDVFDIQHVIDPKPESFFTQMSRSKLRRYVQRNGHCSVLIKVTPGFENLYMGHNTWFVYSSMLRIYKHYNFEVLDKDVDNTRMSFSSYPGYLSSLDDFFILGSGMVMLQTTNAVFNGSLYDLVTPESLLAWQRVRVANLLARNGKEWGEIMDRHNSGTYNNQYMVIDLKKFTPKRGFEDGALYVVEQIPGLVEYGDQTPILREGYWASYNVPFYETIYNMSGYPAMAKRNPDNSHDLAPRAKIFRRDQHSVNSMENFKKMMRFNNYKHDEYSEGNSCNAICCRGDLQNDPQDMGCYDTKVTDFFLAQNFTAFALNGPTTMGESDLPIFKWSSSMPHHIGMPDVYDFPFITMKPKHLK